VSLLVASTPERRAAPSEAPEPTRAAPSVCSASRSADATARPHPRPACASAGDDPPACPLAARAPPSCAWLRLSCRLTWLDL